jgi:hypothetical protein
MSITWNDLAFTPSEPAIAELRVAWSWLLPDGFVPITASTLGDVFFQLGTDAVYWLNTGTAEIARVAASRAEFLELLRTDLADEWFMPHLVEELRAAGKLLEPDHCYTYVTLPVFAGGRYEASNFHPVPAREHFGVTGTMHRQLRDLPEGARVMIRIE